MKYISEKIISELGINWVSLLGVIGDATDIIRSNQYTQPIKPYLRFNDLSNRIIAMPAFIGGKYNVAGIKWIASFPKNITKAIKRAHSVIILNDADTGVPTTLFNTALLSGIRTASVSGFVLQKYFEYNKREGLTCGIIGFGPIGQLHLEMMRNCFQQEVSRFIVYDTADVRKKVDEQPIASSKIEIASSWSDVFEQSDILITCTVSKDRYIDRLPLKSKIYLNISLRDFGVKFLEAIDCHLVDNWDEVCRENTDIEHAYLNCGLRKSDVLEIVDVFNEEKLSNMAEKSFMFNPMGMAVYDMAVAKYYEVLAIANNSFVELEN